VFVCGVATNRALCQFDDMVRYIPSHANALVMVNAEKLFASEVAKSQNWEAQRAKRFESGLTSIPAKASYVVIGSQLDLEVMRSEWDVAIVAFDAAPSLADVSQHFGGIDDTIANLPVLRVADDSYVVRLSDTLLGAFGPGNRQLVAKWLQQADNKLSPYLQEALAYERGGTEVILAIDATDVLTPALVEERLAAADEEGVVTSKVNTKENVQIVSSLKGIMLGVTFGKQPYARLKIDFGRETAPLADVAGPLVLHALANHGAMIDEMEQWKVEVKGTQIFMSGYLEESGLMRVASMINLPTQALHAQVAGKSQDAGPGAAKPAPSPSDPEQLVLETTQNYFKSIDHILKDLKSRKGDARTIGQIGVWFSNYANKVSRLPMLNVDEEMLQYGQYVTQQLRNCSTAIKGAGIAKNVADINADQSAAPLGGVLGQSASNYYASGAYSGGYYGRPLGLPAAYGWAQRQGTAGTAYWAGRSEMRQAFAGRAAVSAQYKAQVGTSVQTILEQLREDRDKVRVYMTKKYNVEF
jgi:hypothetical protein